MDPSPKLILDLFTTLSSNKCKAISKLKTYLPNLNTYYHHLFSSKEFQKGF